MGIQSVSMLNKTMFTLQKNKIEAIFTKCFVSGTRNSYSHYYQPPFSRVRRSLQKVSSGEKPSDAPGQMWVDKYKPRASSEVMGQGGQVKKLKAWLEGWEKWHLGDSGVKPPQVWCKGVQ